MDKKKAKATRFRFTSSTNAALVLVAASTAAHHDEDGSNKSEQWTGVINMLMLTNEVVAYLDTRPGLERPVWRTVQQRFNTLVTERRGQVRKLLAASGISEDPAEMEITLDSLIEELDDKKEQALQAKKEEADAKKRLRDAGDSIREAAVARASSSDDDSPKTKKLKSVASTQSTAEREQALLEMQAKTDARRVQVEEMRIEAEMAKEDAQLKQNEAFINALLELVKNKDK